MFRDRGTRRTLAVIGIGLGFVGTIGVLWAVLLGDAEWWSLVILIPVFAVMRRLYHLLRPSEQ
jgi:hypothetical protein